MFLHRVNQKRKSKCRASAASVDDDVDAPVGTPTSMYLRPAIFEKERGNRLNPINSIITRTLY